jgi:hypothetical protein
MHLLDDSPYEEVDTDATSTLDTAKICKSLTH